MHTHVPCYNSPNHGAGDTNQVVWLAAASLLSTRFCLQLYDKAKVTSYTHCMCMKEHQATAIACPFLKPTCCNSSLLEQSTYIVHMHSFGSVTTPGETTRCCEKSKGATTEWSAIIVSPRECEPCKSPPCLNSALPGATPC
jgi:hypothetical protein